DVADLDVVVGEHDRLEARELRADRVDAGIEVQDLEQALAVGDHGLSDPGPRVGDGHADAGQDTAARVGDGAADATSEVLRGRRCVAEREHSHKGGESAKHRVTPSPRKWTVHSRYFCDTGIPSRRSGVKRFLRMS